MQFPKNVSYFEFCLLDFILLDSVYIYIPYYLEFYRNPPVSACCLATMDGRAIYLVSILGMEFRASCRLGEQHRITEVVYLELYSRVFHLTFQCASLLSLRMILCTSWVLYLDSEACGLKTFKSRPAEHRFQNGDVC